MALAREPLERRSRFGAVLAEHRSPLRRAHVTDERLQRGKERNVALAASRIDGICIEPNQVFSYHHAVGRPSRLRGFRRGSEIHGEKMEEGIGGGCCQVSNLLYWLALNAGMGIVERHRHSFDLYPDQNRTTPFGAGATVFYNFADLRFENPLPQPVLLRIWIDGPELRGEIRALQAPGFGVEVVEEDHHFQREGSCWIRENLIVRRILVEGHLLCEEEIAHNRGVVLYDPSRAEVLR